jgi:hypothetical protein
MAINQNHLFEELNGVKCGIVEKNVTPERVEFLKSLLEFNGYAVVSAPSPPPKTVAQANPNPELTNAEGLPALPATFTLGVTDVAFNPINAIFGRLLKTPDGHTVTLAYWHQKEKISHDEIPYFEDKGD